MHIRRFCYTTFRMAFIGLLEVHTLRPMVLPWRMGLFLPGCGSWDDTMISNDCQWEAVWPDGDFWKAGIMSQGLYVSPDRALVIAFFSVKWDDSIHRYLRPIATSRLFNK